MPRDKDVIDISDLEDFELQEHLRRLSDLASCPCTTCKAICNRYETIYECDAYQLWYEDRMSRRTRKRKK